MDIVIRPARPGDIPGMVELLHDLFSLEAAFEPDSEKQARGLCTLVGDPSARSLVLVADRGGEVAGMAAVQVLVSTAEGGRVGLVEDVVVRQDLRRRGIGTRLLEGIVDWSGKRRLKRLQLLADGDNRPALRFYRSRGWETTNLVAGRLVF